MNPTLTASEAHRAYWAACAAEAANTPSMTLEALHQVLVDSGCSITELRHDATKLRRLRDIRDGLVLPGHGEVLSITNYLRRRRVPAHILTEAVGR